LRGLVLAVLLAAFGARGARAQDAVLRLEMRTISANAQGVVVVDRGARDALEVGDAVRFLPRDGTPYEGVVIEVRERSAVVDLLDESVFAQTGIRAVVAIPRARRARAPTAPTTIGEEHAPWVNPDQAWKPGMPLLAEVRPVRPEDRPMRMSGRLYVQGEYQDSDFDQSYSYLRAGMGLLYENPFGRGGGLRLDGEYNQTMSSAPFEEDEDHRRLRLDRFSYYHGGTRFDATRWEAGRFLHHEVPELGVLDGYEWSARRDDGDRYGASVGFLPDPYTLDEHFEDFQVSGFYRWADRSERLSATGAYQKTFHDGQADRDLVIGKLDYVPDDGWDFRSSTWIDVYTSGDDVKSGVELTQALVSSSRRFDGGHGLTASFVHRSFPELESDDFDLVALDELADAHNDRLSFGGWRAFGDGHRYYGEAGGWVDQEDAGGDLEAGIEFADVFMRDARLDTGIFATAGRFSTVGGVRLGYGKTMEEGSWDVVYQLSNAAQLGFDEENDDVVQHWLRASIGFLFGAGWNVSIYGDGRSFDENTSFSAGFALQKSF
jgi:hypothetical protein